MPDTPDTRRYTHVCGCEEQHIKSHRLESGFLCLLGQGRLFDDGEHVILGKLVEATPLPPSERGSR